MTAKHQRAILGMTGTSEADKPRSIAAWADLLATIPAEKIERLDKADQPTINEKWVADFYDRKRRRHQQVFDHKGDAEKWLRESKTADDKNKFVAARDTVTIAEAAAKWLHDCQHGSGEYEPLERATWKSYEQHCRLHILPRIGHLKLTETDIDTVKQFQTDLREAGTSTAMTKKIVTSLGSIYSDAVERKLCMVNPVSELRAGRRRRGKKIAAKTRHDAPVEVGGDFPTPAEMSAFLAAVQAMEDQPRYRAMLIVTAMTGLRSSELRGLPWSSVNLDDGTITVTQRADRDCVIGPPKSAAAYRTIPLPQLAVNALRQWKEQSGSNDGLVFPTASGKAMNHSNVIKRALKPAMIRAGLVKPDGKPRYSGLHSLRHWCASWMINRPAAGGLGLEVKDVQYRLGHADASLTLNTYSHLWKAAGDNASMAEAEAKLLDLHAVG